jgi:hypothetical protein
MRYSSILDLFILNSKSHMGKEPFLDFETLDAEKFSNFNGAPCILGIDEAGRGPVLVNFINKIKINLMNVSGANGLWLCDYFG